MRISVLSALRRLDRRPRDPSALCRNEAGTVLPFVALAATSLLLFLVLALDSGRVYLARTQLQIAADNAARAALSAAYDDAELPALQARGAGEAAGRAVLANNSVIDGGATLGRQEFSWGSYDFLAQTFTDETTVGGGPRPAAVRVRLDRSRESGAAFRGLFTPIGVQVESIATLRCRDVSIALDLSLSFTGALPTAKTGLEAVINSLMDGGVGGDRLALVTFNGAGTQHGAPRSPTAVSQQDLVPLGSDSSQLVTTVRRLQACQSGACIGTNTAAGIDAARDQLLSSSPTCPGDRLIVLVTDGAPCAGTLGGDDGAYRQATIAAAADLPSSISLSTIYLADPTTEACPGSGIDGEAFAAQLVGGDLGQAFSSTQPQSLAQLLSTSIGSVPVVMVD